MRTLPTSPDPAGPKSNVCESCHHPILKVAMCGNESCSNPEPGHYHCVFAICKEPCKQSGQCQPKERKIYDGAEVVEDFESLKMISFKIDSEGTYPPDREDVRIVGKIRAKYDLAKQRDDENYENFVGRLLGSLDRLSAVKE